MSACIDLISRARHDGYLDKLEFFLERKEMEEVQATLHIIQGFSGADNLAAVRLLDGNGKVIDQVGTLVSLQAAGTPLGGKHDDYMLSVMIAGRPKEPRAYRVLWAGIDAAGKSTMLHRMKHGEFHPSKPTLGMAIETMDFEGHDIENIEIGGHKASREHITSVLACDAKPDAILFVVDAADPARFPEAIDYLASMLHIPQLIDVPLAIIATKHDVPGALSREDIFTGFELKAKVDGRKWGVIEASARTGQGIIDVLHFLATILLTAR
jgi:GTPase SAR1 family protein